MWVNMLNVKRKVMLEVDYYDLEQLVNFTYGFDNRWSFQADQEAGNDTEHTFDVQKEELDEYEQSHLEQFKKNGYGGGWMTQTILTDLCNRGLIEEGEYLIRLSY